MADVVSTAPVAAAGPAVATGATYRPPRLASAEVFDPAKHLCFQEPTQKFTMKELGLEKQGISPVAVTEPFPLFTPAAIRAFREDILSDKILDEYTVSSHISAMQAREFNAKVAPFTCSAWSSPEVTAAVSKAAGIELEPIMTLELGHTNYQAGSDPTRFRETVRQLPIDPTPALPALSPEAKAKIEAENDPERSKQIVDWHFDSYPFVCVTMLSNASTMVGGETALRQGDGSIRKVRGPDQGYAVVLQGRHVKHLACKAFNAYERITMVTSYRAKDSLIQDASVLSTIRYISQTDRLNYQWSLYRMKLLADRFDKYAKALEAKRGNVSDDYFPEVVTREEMKKFAEEQIEYLTTTFEEMM